MRDAYLAIQGLEAGVRLLNCQSLEAILSTVLSRLPHSIVEGEAGPTFASIVSAGGKYRVQAPTLGEPTYQKDPVNAACELASLIAKQMVHGRKDRLALHAAAIAVEDALIVFPSGRRAGKSLLTVALADLGVKVFGDDVVPVKLVPETPIEGIALGISPRIRLPLPPSATILNDRLVGLPAAENDQYRYVAVPELAPFGEQLPIAAFVTLVPAEGASPRLSAMSQGSTLNALLKQNFGRSSSAEAQLIGLHALASTALSLELAYTNPTSSAALIMSELVPQLRSNAPVFSPQQPSETAGTPNYTRNEANRAFQRNDNAVMRQLDGECFAASTDGSRVLRFNEGMHRIWTLLAEPASPTELIVALQAAFPDVSPDQIDNDVNHAVSELAGADLIRPCVTP